MLRARTRPPSISSASSRHDDTPVGEEVFDTSETQAEAVVEPDGC